MCFFNQVIVGQSIGLLISTAIADVFTAQSFSFVLILSLMLFGEWATREMGVFTCAAWAFACHSLYMNTGCFLVVDIAVPYTGPL